MTDKDRQDIARAGKRLVKALHNRDAPPPNKEKLFTMRVEEAELEAIKSAAKALDLSAAEYLLELHRAYIQERDKK